MIGLNDIDRGFISAYGAEMYCTVNNLSFSNDDERKAYIEQLEGNAKQLDESNSIPLEQKTKQFEKIKEAAESFYKCLGDNSRQELDMWASKIFFDTKGINLPFDTDEQKKYYCKCLDEIVQTAKEDAHKKQHQEKFKLKSDNFVVPTAATLYGDIAKMLEEDN